MSFILTREYAKQGNLTSYIAKNGPFANEDEPRKLFRQLVSAIDHSHAANVVHRDLKLENLLLDEHYNILLADFGLGRTFEDESVMNTFCGTPEYASFELISGIPYVGTKADIWSMGVILFTMLHGTVPFHGSTLTALYRNIKEIRYHFPKSFSHDLKDLFKSIFVKENQRIDMDSLRLHPWVTPPGMEPPPRILPLITGIVGFRKLSRVISSINSDQKSTTITIQTPKLGLHGRRQSFQPSMLTKSPPEVKSSHEDHIPSDNGHKRRSTSIFPSLARRTSHMEHKKESPTSSSVNTRQKQHSLPPLPVNEVDIVEWHRIHRPPKEIRTFRLSLSIFASSSTISPAIMFQDLHKALLYLKVIQPELVFKRIEDWYKFQCKEGDVEFEIELCKVWGLKLFGFKLEAIKGDKQTLKFITNTIKDQLGWR